MCSPVASGIDSPEIINHASPTKRQEIGEDLLILDLDGADDEIKMKIPYFGFLGSNKHKDNKNQENLRSSLLRDAECSVSFNWELFLTYRKAVVIVIIFTIKANNDIKIMITTKLL